MSNSITSNFSFPQFQPRLQGGPGQMPRPDPGAMAEKLFSQLDSKGTGYLEAADLKTALDGSGASSGSDAQALFKQLDGDGDGKVTKDEFSSTLESMFKKLDDQFMRMRLDAANGEQQPTQANDSGLSKDELGRILENLGSSGQGSLLNSLLSNFDQADSDGNGRIGRAEARQFADAARDSQSAEFSTGRDSDLSAQMVHQVLRLMAAYGQTQTSGDTQTLSATA